MNLIVIQVIGDFSGPCEGIESFRSNISYFLSLGILLSSKKYVDSRDYFDRMCGRVNLTMKSNKFIKYRLSG